VPGAAAAGAPRAATSAAGQCTSSTFMAKGHAIITAAQLTADLGQKVTFSNESGPASNITCTWLGKALPKSKNPEALKNRIVFGLMMQKFATTAAASKAYGSESTSFGKPTPVPGVGSKAVFMPGQDIVTLQMMVLSHRTIVYMTIGEKNPKSQQKAQLKTVAAQVLFAAGAHL